MSYRKEPKASAQPSPRANSPLEFSPPPSFAPEWTPPAGAATIWLNAAGEICLGLPSAAPGKSHTVKVPQTLDGMALLIKVLRQRDMQREAPKLNERGSPTQAILDAMLRDPHREAREAKLRKEREERKLRESFAQLSTDEQFDALFS